MQELVPSMSHFWRDLLTVCLGTDTGNTLFANQTLMGAISRNRARALLLENTVNALSVAPIYTPARLTPIMAAANKYYQIYKQNPDRVNSILAHGVTALRVSHS